MTKQELMKTVGENLKRYRDERNLTQEQLAELAGISTSHCANIERGEKAVSVVSLRNLADSLRISTDYLLYEDRKDVRIQNIERLLVDQPESVINMLEKLIRLCVEEAPNINGGNSVVASKFTEEDV